MTHAPSATMGTKIASCTATLDGVSFSGANPAGIRNRMIIARATAPIATSISRKISSRHPARNPLGPIITAERPIMLLSIIVLLERFDSRLAASTAVHSYAKFCLKVSLAIARGAHGHVDFFLSKYGSEAINSLAV